MDNDPDYAKHTLKLIQETSMFALFGAAKK